MEIKPSGDLEIQYKGQSIKVTRPKVGYLRDFKKRLKKVADPTSDETEVDVMYDYCTHLGVPKDVLDSWDLKEMAQLFSILNEDEKKSLVSSS